MAENCTEDPRLENTKDNGDTSEPDLKDPVKLFCILAGKTNNSQKRFTATLKVQIQNLIEVSTVDESDIVLVFCPIVSRAGTDIKAALKKFDDSTASKLKVLVVLHHTFDPEKIVPNSSRCVKREDILAVDCLFYEDTGLLQCQKNDDAMDEVVHWLMEQGKTTAIKVCLHQSKLKAPDLNTKHSTSSCSKTQFTLGRKRRVSDKNEGKMEAVEPKRVKRANEMRNSKTDKVKVRIIVSEKVKEETYIKFFKTLSSCIKSLEKVSTVDESDIVLVFCPIVSRAGTDIKAALKKFDDSTASKLKVLVVLHHTFDPEKIVPNSSRCVKREDILAVDCLFYEDTGLLQCQKNDDAMDEVVHWLMEQGKTMKVNIRPKSSGNKCCYL